MAKRKKPRTDSGSLIVDWMADRLFGGVFALVRLLPYRWRIPLMGRIAARIVAPLAGYSARIRANLNHVMPDLPEAQVHAVMRAAPDGFGRAFMETWSAPEFMARLHAEDLTGPGVAAVLEARDAKRPIVFVSGHIGNANALRGVLIKNGVTFGSLYNPLKNRYFNARYLKYMSVFEGGMFPRTRRGYADMVGMLKRGENIGIMFDQHMNTGTPMPFFGKPAMTPTSAPAMAMRHDALLVPIYSIRRPDGLSYDVVVEAPIPHTEPEEMVMKMNQSLEARIRANMGQWMWFHRRWKPEKMRDRPGGRQLR